MSPISNSSSSSVAHSDLPISRRGLFFQDSAFEDACEQLNNNVRRILQRWGETDFLKDLSDDPKLRSSNTLNRFRQLRRCNLKEEDQAVTVASDATSHKIVMDVHDFVGGEVKVRVEGERALVVEGRTETKTGGWSASSNCFSRRFYLPANIDLEAVSAALSDDGVLTVTAPLLSVARAPGYVEVPLFIQDTRTKGLTDVRSGFASSMTTNAAGKSTCTCPHGQQDWSCAANPGREHIIPIRIDDGPEESSRSSLSSEDTQTARESRRSESTWEAKVKSTAKNTSEASSRNSRCANSPSASSRASSVNFNAIAEGKASIQSFSMPMNARTRGVPINQLPITRRGRFFDDSFFAGLRQDFQSAVNDVLGRWGEASVLNDDRDDANRLGRYRQLREHNLNVESQAVTVTSDEASHKIVMDVRDFMGGEVKARVEGERELVVEGRIGTKTGDWAVCSNSFRRRFCLPANTDLAAVSAVLSDDGILTVTAPRLTKQRREEEINPIKTKGSYETREENTTSTTSNSFPATATPHSFNASRQTSTVSTQTDSQISGLPDSFTEARKDVIRDMKDSFSMVHEASEQQSTHDMRVPGSVLLPITTRGMFFSDSVFEKAWEDFHEAVRDVVSKWGDPACPADDLTHYRSLRERDLRDENQAVKLAEDESFYKIVVDVQDFMKGGNVAVRSVQDRELAVEGNVERQGAGERYKQHFHRRFVLPRNIYSESVSSVMSADGVLIIKAPKKPSAPPVRETIIPVGVEEGVHRTESLSHISKDSFKSQIENRTVQASVTSTTSAERSSHVESLTENYSSDSSEKVASSRERILPVMLEEEESHSVSRSEVSTSSVEGNTQSTRQSLESSHVHDVDSTTMVSEIPMASKTLSSSTSVTEGNDVTSVNNEDFQVANETGMQRPKRSKDNAGGVTFITTVPIILKGDFFSDSFFEDMRKQFTTAVQDVLQMSDAASSFSDEVANYRSHLRRNPRLENQAVYVEEDVGSFKVALDVHEFVDGELKVEVEDNRALVVEGQASCEEGASSSTLTFRRIFLLPSQADVAAITSALSSDGVLIIFAPKQQQNAEFAADRIFHGRSSQDDHTTAAQAWKGQRIMQEVTKSESSFSETYSSSSSSNSSSSSSSSSAQQKISSHNVPSQPMW